MKKASNRKRAMLSGVLALLLCVSMLIGTTFAWFSARAGAGTNRIQSGNLDVTLEMKDENGDWVDVADKTLDFVKSADAPEDESLLWEPGCAYNLPELRVVNKGSLALKYKIAVTGITGDAGLLDVIEFKVGDKTLDEYFLEVGHLIAEQSSDGFVISGHWAPTDCDNDYKGMSIGGVAIMVYATQDTVESDSFGSDYDAGAEFPALIFPAPISVAVTPDAGNKVPAGGVSIGDVVNGVGAFLPEGVQLNDGVDALTLSVSLVAISASNVITEPDQVMVPLDVHIEGVSDANAIPITIYLGKVLPSNMNSGAIRLYHVESGITTPMTYVVSVGDFTAHNQFTYDPSNGALTLYMAIFSEVTTVTDTENPWDGQADTTWYAAAGTAFRLYNADDLAGFAELVDEGVTFAGKTVELAANINLYGTADGKRINFEAVGDPAHPFQGIFDGAGHEIANLYQNGWEMGYTERVTDGLGLFSHIKNGTVRNLTVNGSKMVMQYTDMGCVAAYASGSCTFESISLLNNDASTYNCAVAGIVGSDDGISSFTFRNITIDNSNAFHALWGTYDCAAGGLLGWLNEDSSASMTNCHVAATMDVYNDVCGNYQYYWYRYCGMLIGTVCATKTEGGNTVLDLSKITATGCTVHFGDWNDYYYCEFEKNGHPSYAQPDQYKFSRVPQEELIISGKGTVTCTHTHTPAEDNRAVYLPFNQIFGGRGWGVRGTQLGAVDGVEVLDLDEALSVEKFDRVFPIADAYLYRVGNANTVSLGSLFKAKAGVGISIPAINSESLYVSITDVADDISILGTYTANASDWTQGTLKFNGTGPVKVTIQDYQYCQPTVLYLEVVDGNNVTAFSNFSGTNKVLLNDIAITSGSVCSVSNGTLYGNGFTFDLTQGRDDAPDRGILNMTDATLDNVKLVGAVYTTYAGSTGAGNSSSSATVICRGASEIINSYISNCRAPLRLAGGTLTLKNSTLYGGRYANADIQAGTLLLDHATTINDSGLGIVISEASTSAKISGTVTQYNWVCESDKSKFPSAFQSLFSAMFGNAAYRHSYSGTNYVNTGILSLTSAVGAGSVNCAGYTRYDVSYLSVTGSLWTIAASGYTLTPADLQYRDGGPYTLPADQGNTKPAYTWSYPPEYDTTAKAIVLNFEQGASASIDPHILTATKYGRSLDVAVSVTSADPMASGYSGTGEVAFSLDGTSTITYTITDDRIYNADGTLSGNLVYHTVTVPVIVTTITTQAPPSFTFYYGTNGSPSAGTPHESQPTASKTGRIVTAGADKYIMPDVAAVVANQIGSKTVNGVTVYYPIVDGINVRSGKSSDYDFQRYYPIFKAVAISDDGTAYTYASIKTMPATLLWVSAEIDSGNSSSGLADGTTLHNSTYLCRYQTKAGNTERGGTSVVKYRYTGKDGVDYYYYVGYRFYDEVEASGSCVASGTMITLADGSKKAVEDLTLADNLLVFDHEKGKYATANILFIEADGVKTYDVLNLKFANGTTTRIIYEHALFDVTLNKYVYITKDTLTDYIGHKFATGNGKRIKTTKLVESYMTTEITGCYSLVTNYHLNYFIDGLLSIPGGINGLFNIFEYGNGLKFDKKKMQADMDTYGLFTYEDFADYVTEDVFNAYPTKYLKVSIGKGYMTFDDIMALIERYGIHF